MNHLHQLKTNEDDIYEIEKIKKKTKTKKKTIKAIRKPKINKKGHNIKSLKM